MSAHLLLSALLLAAVPPEAPAGEVSSAYGPRDHSVELGIAGGAFLSPSAEGLTRDPSAGQVNQAGLDFMFRLSYAPFSFIGLEAEAGHIALDTSSAQETGAFVLRGHLIGQLPYRFSPFLLAGGGVIGLTTENEAMGGRQAAAFHYGVGLKFFANKDVVARFDARHTMSLADAGLDHHFEVLAGMSFTLVSAD